MENVSINHAYTYFKIIKYITNIHLNGTLIKYGVKHV